MKRLRKIIFWCHLSAGVFAGVVILIMSVTGVLLTYERQIIAWADTRGYGSTPPAGASALPVETLLARARAARPAQPATLTLRADAAAPAEVGYGREGAIFLNPYTGEVLGEGSRHTRAFFQTVTDWHRWLGAGGGQARGPQPEIVPEGLNGLWARAAGQQSDWRIISLRLPTAADKTATFTIDSGTGGQPQKRAQLTLDRRTGEVSKWEPFSQLTPGRRLRSYLRLAHTGEVLGLAGQTVAGLASAGGALLVWTGLALAWRRWLAWARRRSAGVEEVVAGAAVASAQRAD